MDEFKMRVNALWIDDLPSAPDSDEFFEDLAADAGIYITNATNVDDGIKLLNNPSLNFDAIILDINCYKHGNRDEVIDMSALSYAIQKLKEIDCEVPHFVYSALGPHGKTIVDIVIPEINPWDNRKIYHKTKDRNDLFDAIKYAVQNRDDFKLKSQYADAFGFVSDGKLLDIVKTFQSNGINTNSNFPKSIRDFIEDIAHKLQSYGLVELSTEKNNHSKDLSNYLKIREKNSKVGNKYVPTYIQRALHMLSECCNEGAHGYEDDIKQYKIPFLISQGKAPYLNSILFYELILVLAWCNQLPVDSKNWREEWKQYFKDIR